MSDTRRPKYKLTRIRTAEFNQVNVDLINEAFDSITDVTGPDGAQGIQGKPGTPGTDGKDGADGIDGAEGIQGPRGYTGLTGKEGEKGDIGETGKDSYVAGPKGDQGDIGEDGLEGPMGPVGGAADVKFRIISFDLTPPINEETGSPYDELADGEMTVNNEVCEDTTIISFGERDNEDESTPPLDTGDIVEIGPARYRVQERTNEPRTYNVEHIVGGDLFVLDFLEKVVPRPVDNQVHDSLQAQIDELTETKGAIAQFVVKSIGMEPATRAGELITNNANAADVTWISLASVDNNSNVTKTVSTQDILEVGSSRFVVTDATQQPTSMTVMYVSGDQVFTVEKRLDLYIFPQNAESASVDYVNEQDTILLTHVNTQDSSLQDQINAIDLSGDVSKEYVDEQIGTRMSKEGEQNLQEGDWRIKKTRSTGGVASYIIIDNDRMELNYVSNPIADTDATNKGYVDSVGDTKIGKAGQQTLEDGEWSLKQATSTGGLYEYIDIKDGVMSLGHVSNPIDDHDVANRNYVDLGDDALREKIEALENGGTSDDSKLDKAGGVMTGAIDMGSNDIKATGDLETSTATIGSVRMFSNNITGYGGTLQLASQVIVKRVGNAKSGFTIKGEDVLGYTNALFQVYHNPFGTLDAINYYGLTENAQNIQTKESVQGLFRASTKELTADVEAQFAVRDALIEKQGKVIEALTKRINKLEK